MATKNVHIEYTGSTTKYESATNQMKNINNRTTKTIQDSWRAVGTVIAGVFAFRQAFSFFTEAAKMAGVQQKSIAGLHQAMVAMGRYTPEFEKSLIDQAKALQTVTLYGDETIIAGQKFLMTYRQIPDELMPRATRAMLDFAALMGGDTMRAANALGKAAMGLTGELRRIGITIDPVIAKSGDFAAILGEIEKQIGGQARALAETGIGPWEQLAMLWGDAKESIGELVLQITKGMIPAIKDWIQGVQILSNEFQKLVEGPSSMDITRVQAEKLRAKIAEIDELMGRKRSPSENFRLTILAPNAERIALLRQQLSILDKTMALEKKGVFTPVPVLGPKPPPAAVAPGKFNAPMESIEYEIAAALSAAKIRLDQETSAAEESTTLIRLQTEQDAANKSIEMRVAAIEQQKEAQLGLSAFLIEQWQIEAEEEMLLEKWKVDTRKRYNKASLDNLSWFLQQTGKESKVAFKAWQGVEIARAVVSGIVAAVEAWEAGMSVGGPYAPAVAAAYAAASLLKTGAMISSISSAGSQGGGGATATYPVSPVSGLPEIGTPESDKKGLTINLNIEGDYFDSMESRQAIAEFLTEYVERYGGDLAASRTA